MAIKLDTISRGGRRTAEPPPPAPVFSAADLDLMAERVAASQLFPDIKTKQAAFALMLLSQAEGLHPAQALRRYHIVKSRPTMKADAMLAEFQARGGRVKWLKRTDEEVSAVFRHPEYCPEGETIAWDKERASRAGLWSNGIWRNFPRQMLTARVISEGVRLVDPGVVLGIYTPEEVQDLDDPIRVNDATGNADALPPPRSPRATPAPAQGVSPAAERAFEGWLKGYLERVERHWIDYWDDRLDGDVPDVGQCLPHFRLRNHLCKWLGHDPGGMKFDQESRLLAAEFARNPVAMKAEVRRYIADTVFPGRVKEVEDRFGLGRADEPGIAAHEGGPVDEGNDDEEYGDREYDDEGCGSGPEEGGD